MTQIEAWEETLKMLEALAEAVTNLDRRISKLEKQIGEKHE